ncbi:hypothetical protein [Streptomyces sp. FH025]|uniref:hypothetical protein n=1 Tax=Streptomyces sp. FH025 TaxID=2815937 RepID=UPI001A9D034B|nr:hypothetical protein [Streptomyces sp. FH025]MBO1414121.1 hypothetical protein [Streptomyces sp. FH025]
MSDNQSTPAMKDLPIRIQSSGKRQEFDSMGTVEVPADRYWGEDHACHHLITDPTCS